MVWARTEKDLTGRRTENYAHEGFFSGTQVKTALKALIPFHSLLQFEYNGFLLILYAAQTSSRVLPFLVLLHETPSQGQASLEDKLFSGLLAKAARRCQEGRKINLLSGTDVNIHEFPRSLGVKSFWAEYFQVTKSSFKAFGLLIGKSQL